MLAWLDLLIIGLSRLGFFVARSSSNYNGICIIQNLADLVANA